jgi:hypothetical protein
MSPLRSGAARFCAAVLARARGLVVVPALLTVCSAQAVTLPGTPPTEPPASAVYRQECAACHLAYPPDLLSARAWKRLLAGLPKHFGTDASLDAEAARKIETWLTARAGPPGDEPADNRITHTGWYRNEHAELPASVWKRPAIRSASNCSACHRGAEQGDFDEDRVQVPR